jgi:hypothetical protein
MALSPEFRALFEHSPIPMYLWVQSGPEFMPVLKEFNAAAMNLTSGRIVELLGKTYMELYADDPQIQQDFHVCFSEFKPLFRRMKYRSRLTGKIGEFDVAYIPVTLDTAVVAVVSK